MDINNILSAAFTDAEQTGAIVRTADGQDLQFSNRPDSAPWHALQEWLDADPARVIEPWTDPRSDADRWADDHRAELDALADIDRRMTPRMIREALLSGNVDAIRALEDEAAPIRAALPPKPMLPQGPKTAKA